MTHAYPSSMAGPRRTTVLASIVALHFGTYLAILNGMRIPVPAVVELDPPEVELVQREPELIQPQEPGPAEPVESAWIPVERPVVPLPVFDPPHDDALQVTGAGDGASSGSGVGTPAVDNAAAALTMRDSRLAALINSCYPAASRRMGEEGKAIARVTVGPEGAMSAWAIHASSGFPRLDAALDCVVRRIAFVPARRDGRAVQSEVLLPIVFRLD